jgi:hypothetical protein
MWTMSPAICDCPAATGPRKYSSPSFTPMLPSVTVSVRIRMLSCAKRTYVLRIVLGWADAARARRRSPAAITQDRRTLQRDIE